MVSRIVDQVVGMRLEIQLLNSSTWLAYGDSKNPSQSPVESFIHMVSKGSRELDAIILRSTCPYLYRIWAQPLFQSAAAEDKQEQSLLLQKLGDTVLGLVFTFLAEEDLARSISSVCVRFRTCIVSKTHVEALLGKALSTEMSELFKSSPMKSKDSALTLADRLSEMASSMANASVAFQTAPSDVLGAPLDELSKLDKALMMIFTAVPDCAKRLSQLAIALTSRTVLQRDRKLVERILKAIRTIASYDSPTQRILLHLIGAALAFGRSFGHNPGTLNAEEEDDQMSLQGFSFLSLTELGELQSKFYRGFTASAAVILHALEKHHELWGLVRHGYLRELHQALIIVCGDASHSVFQLLDGVRSTVNKIKKMAAETHAAAAMSAESFHCRLSHLSRILESQCREVDERLAVVSHELAEMTAWLVPLRLNSTGYVPIHGTNGELKALRDFVSLICDLTNGDPSLLRELAQSATALETSAVARSASQRALMRQNSAPQRQQSTEFSSARKLVSLTLDPGASIKQNRESRMTEVLQHALSDEEQARRKSQLEAVLKLRAPESVPLSSSAEAEPVPAAPDAQYHAAADRENERGADARTLPVPMAEQIKAMRGDNDGGKEEDIEESPIQSQMTDAPVEQEMEETKMERESDVPVADKETEEASEQTSPTKSVSVNAASTENSPNLDLKTTKVWKWMTFRVSMNEQAGIWKDVNMNGQTYLSPMTDDEERVLKKLFSRGPEVAFTVGAHHQKLKHFTSEDFSGLKSQTKRGAMESSWLIDLDRTKKAVQSLPQVRAAGLGSPPANTKAASAQMAKQSPSTSSANVERELESKEEPHLLLPLARILELKKQNKLATVNLQPHCLEKYLSEDEFTVAFKMSRADFEKLPGWKRDKIKKELGIF